MAEHHPTPPASSASSAASFTDFDYHGNHTHTLAELINAIEADTNANVVTLSSGLRTHLLIYLRDAQPPVVDVNLMVDEAVKVCEAAAVIEATHKTMLNIQQGRRRVNPKCAYRVDQTIHFHAGCTDNKCHEVSWTP
uniref:Uncharacterized protein n=1 Tax=Globodera rostochiensis TaxID=31243 RepID=A0A914GXW1_GLORO